MYYLLLLNFYPFAFVLVYPVSLFFILKAYRYIFQLTRQADNSAPYICYNLLIMTNLYTLSTL